ncbi:MAG: hypothetical protein L6Q95_02355 [Planctomycetes bacterium]|nr:hypothetical protein [Planctomycetota bacterium]
MLSRLPLVALLALLAACGPKPNPRLAPLAHARLEAGKGLGDLTLGKTTLGEFVDRFGTGFVTFVASDDAGLELIFEEAEIAFLFQFESMRWDDAEGQAIRRASGDLEGYLAAYPDRRGLLLTSITVRVDADRESTFYKGKLAEGVALFDPFLESAGRVGPVEEGSLPLIAGLNPNNPRETASFPKRGLILYGARDPRPGTPSVVTRMTVFLPASPGDTTDEAGDGTQDEEMIDDGEAIEEED